MRPTIHNSFCVPTTSDEWNMLPNRRLWCRNNDAVFGNIDFEKQNVVGKKKIPVSVFVQLITEK